MASAPSANGLQGPLDIGAIIGTSLAVWPRLMLAFGPIYALQVLPDVLQGPVLGTQDQGAGLLTMFLADMVGLLISIVCLGGLTTVATQVLDGGEPRIVEALDVGMRRFLPVLGACGLAGLLLLVGFLLLLVPGLVLSTWYFLVVPACILETLGPGASLRRSAALSQGTRWRIFALVLVIAAAALVGTAFSTIAEKTIGGIGAAIVEVLAGTAVGIFAGTVPVVTYRALACGVMGISASRFGAFR
jgi:hypothetical protein